jgi:hypothetical protein
VNRSATKNHYIQLNLAGFTPLSTTGTWWQIYSPSITDNNGCDIIPQLGLNYTDPSTTVSHIQIQAQSVAWNRTLVLPPHSVATLEIDGR